MLKFVRKDPRAGRRDFYQTEGLVTYLYKPGNVPGFKKNRGMKEK